MVAVRNIVSYVRGDKRQHTSVAGAEIIGQTKCVSETQSAHAPSSHAVNRGMRGKHRGVFVGPAAHNI